jgi:hypothetical protein
MLRDYIASKTAYQGNSNILFKEVADAYTDALYESTVIIANDSILTETPHPDELKSLPLPSGNVFVEIKGTGTEKGRSFGVWLVKEHYVTRSTTGTWVLMIYNKDNQDKFVELMSYVFIEKLPRVNICCPNTCEKQLKPTQFSQLMVSSLCMKTHRTAECGFAKGIHAGLSAFIAVLKKFNLTSKKVNKLPYEDGLWQDDGAQNVLFPEMLPKKHSQRNSTNSVTYLSDRITSYTPRGGHHASPAPHHRRGHTRTLKSGKQIWVKESQINGGSAKNKIYKIT